MSVIEVAGLVLAIIPIITSALGALDRAPDKYARPDIVDSLKAVYGDVYDAIESDLIHIRILMADLCERLGLGHIIETWALSAPGSTSMLFSTVHTIENDSAPELHSNPLARPLVSDICAEVEPRPQKSSSPVLEIHFSLGSDPGSLQMSQRPTVQAVLKDSISLYQLLEQPAPQSGYFAPRRLGEKDRRFLATRIALYALQLQGTPWTSGKWTGHAILFVSRESPELPRPSISKSFQRSAQATSLGADNQAQHVYSHRFFLALATLLMELYVGEAMDEDPSSAGTSHQRDSPDFTKLVALQILRERRQSDTSDAYQKAIQYCLASALNAQFTLDMDVDTAIEEIVYPLVREYEIFTGHPPSRNAVALEEGSKYR
ncbi:uncharacterized protein MYCGRDRAFT_90850 [Zymoseptoria tritici IPO323]|uniref:DUF7580 domain-containing protein n=1 Tax=Zymoseptoria tritici (strain CBS 115943 / IPO323) TaxID=336722 RepID=F9X4J2_ZYMTI|nr:uncharacterized protein MYCGRDRAFT_90850 [Zymoseptoria tritici IPO323]EGP90470.1 hypothetical protein MYCGRDRAFT_90850 [Zymoseptoria tritici IPO323]